MLEHSSGKATWKDVPILEWAGRLGAQLSGEADDHTTFTVRGSSTFSDWHLWRLHWLLENGAYTKEDLVRAREDTARRIAGKHAGRAWRRALSESLFGRDHPYARTASSADVDRVFDVDDLESFREERYRANGAVLIIVGQFEVPAMTKTVTELFGAWTNDAPPPLVPVPAMHPATGPTWIADVDPDASQVRIGVGFAATSPRDRSRGARAVVAEMVRNRLAQVRTRMGASYGVRASYMTTEAGDAITADGHVDADRAGDALRLMLRALDGLRIGDDELTADFVRARRTALARALGDPQISGTVADQLEATASRGQPIDAATQLPAAIAATTLRDVRAVIAADLVPAHMVVLLGGRQADSKAAFTAAGVTRFQTVSDDPPSP
jgi:predicted Zn-dependent peptidase